MGVEQRAPENIRSLATYVPGKPISELARESGLSAGEIVKLASNENPLGMSPMARRAMQEAVHGLSLYPDGNAQVLKEVVGRHHGVPDDCIVVGNGSNDVLELVARTFLSQGSSAVHSEHAFAVYPIAIRAAGARCIEVPSRNFGHDLAAMADAVAPDTRVVFIANPNNPTGSFLPGPMVEQFLARVERDVVVVLDEAYCQYLPSALAYDSVSWLERHPNLVITRTFSKIFGMAGLRVGYALCHPEVADLMNRVRQPFNVNSLAQAAACGALADEEFVARSAQINREGMKDLEEGLRRLGLRVLPSCANFLCFRAGCAEAINRALLKDGVIVRPLASYGMPEWLRVTIGLPSENERFLASLSAALKGHDV
ncbi:histidinol-phosphate transaminase [Uliginosibacterium paludis]|uniref:Histidinol-phosphate aminotransferase n=1 Tax=Uliginosibacterium paludis TaxID=1615952 RepID=A0ABV2CL54_9RHOO